MSHNSNKPNQKSKWGKGKGGREVIQTSHFQADPPEGKPRGRMGHAREYAGSHGSLGMKHINQPKGR